VATLPVLSSHAKIARRDCVPQLLETNVGQAFSPANPAIMATPARLHPRFLNRALKN
jgi:hypothetical protein